MIIKSDGDWSDIWNRILCNFAFTANAVVLNIKYANHFIEVWLFQYIFSFFFLKKICKVHSGVMHGKRSEDARRICNTCISIFILFIQVQSQEKHQQNIWKNFNKKKWKRSREHRMAQRFTFVQPLVHCHVIEPDDEILHMGERLLRSEMNGGI